MKIRGNTVGTPIRPEKVVVKCQNLTEEEKATARNNIGALSENINGGSLSGVNSIVYWDSNYQPVFYTLAELEDNDPQKPILELYGDQGDEQVVLRGVADGVYEYDAATVGQVNSLIDAKLGVIENGSY